MDKMNNFYNSAIDAYGLYDPRALHWQDPFSQLERFRILCEVGPLAGKEILDVGCGFGDLYGYIVKKCGDVSYTGIDINERMIDAARAKYSNATFIAQDFYDYNGTMVDFALASGAFSYKIPDHKQMYFGFIRKMYDLSRKAVAFNMLNARYHVDDEIYAAYLATEVYDWCTSFTDKILIRQDYMYQDFTVYLYH
jgi:trans-aconitate methyltransferase